ncbi:NUDIX domain-containing protein [Curtobacterium sp. Curtsp57]|uniref:NUDIX domain-containing protein n=1 Tax=Curtobacterium sp. Curtsp57 TaxID=3243047 RepID=UPI0039B3EE6C
MSEQRDVPYLSVRDGEDAAHSPSTGSVAVLWCPDGLLLHHRDDDPSISNPGRWSLFGGATDPNETPEQTVIRELHEELSVRARVDRTLWRVVDREGDGRLLHVFEMTTASLPADMELNEGQGFAAFSLTDALSLDLAPLARRVIQALRPAQADRDGGTDGFAA